MAETVDQRPSGWWTVWLALFLLGGIWLGISKEGGILLSRLGWAILLVIGIEGFIKARLNPKIALINRTRAVSRIITSVGTVLVMSIIFKPLAGSAFWWQYLGKPLWSRFEVDPALVAAGFKAWGYSLALRFIALVGVVALVII